MLHFYTCWYILIHLLARKFCIGLKRRYNNQYRGLEDRLKIVKVPNSAHMHANLEWDLNMFNKKYSGYLCELANITCCYNCGDIHFTVYHFAKILRYFTVCDLIDDLIPNKEHLIRIYVTESTHSSIRNNIILILSHTPTRSDPHQKFILELYQFKGFWDCVEKAS